MSPAKARPGSDAHQKQLAASYNPRQRRHARWVRAGILAAAILTVVAVTAVLTGWPLWIEYTSTAGLIVILAHCGPLVTDDPDPQYSRLDRMDGLR